MRRGKFSVRGMLAVMTLASAWGAGCVGGSKGTSRGDLERLKPYILESVPSDLSTKVDINFENKVHLVGYKLEPAGKAGPGTDITLTMYWRSDEKLDDGWSLFTHVLDSAGERVLNIDNVGPLREMKDNHQILSPSSWEKGKVYVDEQKFRLPDDLKTAELSIVTGIWKGDARLKVVGGPSDSENRGIVAHLKTGVDKPAAPAHTELPHLRLQKLAKDQKITIDGKLDEEAWNAGAKTGPFVDVGTGNPNTSFPVNASAKLAWDDSNLYVGFQVTDPDIIGGFKEGANDPHLWEKDTVEIMVDPEGDGDNKDYYEIQVNPQNLVFDTQYDSYNSPQTQPSGPFGHEEWSAKLKSAVVVDGTVDKSGDKDNGYTVEIALPWSSFTKAKGKAPAPETEWRVNLYAMKNNGGVAWSPILGQGNFHKATRFGRVVFATSAAPPLAVASGAPLGGQPSPGPAGTGTPAGSAVALGSALPAGSARLPSNIARRDLAKPIPGKVLAPTP